MKTLDDIEIEGFLRILLWAPPGAGKTALAATFPGVIFVDFDGGLKTLKGKWFKKNRKKPDLIGYDTFDNTYDRFGVFKTTSGYWDAMKFVNQAEENPACKTIVIDSVTVLQSLGMHVGIEAAGRAKRSQTQNAAKKTHVLLPTQADFGAEMSAFEQFMNEFVKMKKNLICIAHEREVTTETGALMRREPYLIGSSIRAQVAKWFDEVWYLDVRANGSRRLLTQQTNIMKVNKSRSGVPDGLEDPTYDKIMKELRSS